MLTLGHALAALVIEPAIGPRSADELEAHRLPLTREDRGGFERAAQQRREGDLRLHLPITPCLGENLLYPHGRTIKKKVQETL